MQALKPIETIYHGYRFRSRLEARWAVFFDALNIRWEYEKEGYDLGPAGWYLPDFWLPDLGLQPNTGIWVEVKGQATVDREIAVATALSAHAAVLVVVGDPYEFDSRLFEFGIEPIPEVLWKFGCREGKHPEVAVAFQKTGPWYWCPRIRDAAERARQKRFEQDERERSPTVDTWDRRLNGWATKVYGEDWEDSPGYEVAEEAFTGWLNKS